MQCTDVAWPHKEGAEMLAQKAALGAPQGDWRRSRSVLPEMPREKWCHRFL